ncbi:MAG: permease-like cell division protein FtsX [Actinobacteria bacterium]|nr:permease-like cell division protein FtsX [Actinomycetota bacterium]
MRFSWFFGEAFKSMVRNGLMTIASILTIGLSLFIVGLFIFASVTINQTIGSFEKQLEIEVFLKDEASPQAVQELQDRINSWPEVETVAYISKEEALQRFKQRYKDHPELIENIQGNPLPASFVIRLKDPQKVESVARRFNGNPAVEDVEYGQKYVKRLFEALNVVRYSGFAFILLLAFVSVILISITIRLAIFARRQEISIMRLVGASNWFIRLPFIIEGCFQGLLGAIIASSAVYIVRVTVLEKLRSQILWLPLNFDSTLFWQITAGLCIGGLALGALGSAVAMRRYLRV